MLRVNADKFVYIRDSIPHRILQTHSGITNAIEYMSFEVCFNDANDSLSNCMNHPKLVMNVHGGFCLSLLIILSIVQI